MKECNNCGYQGLLDHAKKCKCGAIEKPNYILISLLIMLKVTLFIAVEASLVYFLYSVFFFLYPENNIPEFSNSLLFGGLLWLFVFQCITYAVINKSFTKEKNAITTTFSKIEKEENECSTNVLPQSSSTASNNTSNDNLLTGIVIGAVATNLLSADDNEHSVCTISSTDDNNSSLDCSNSCD